MQRRIGPDYVRRVRLTLEAPDRLSLRSAPAAVDFGRAMLVLLLPSTALSFCAAGITAGMTFVRDIAWIIPRPRSQTNWWYIRCG